MSSVKNTTDLFNYVQAKTGKKTVFYDIEVVEKWWLVCFEEFNGGKVNITSENPDMLKEYIKTVGFLIGFNNHHYDDHILSAMLNDKTCAEIKKISDKIINENQKYYTKLNGMISLDAKQGLDLGLKKFAANFGYNVKESSVSFDITHYPTKQEQQDLIDYCFVDVDILKKLWFTKNSPFARQDYFNGNLSLILDQKLPVDYLRKTTAQLVDYIFKVRETDNLQLFEKSHFDIFKDNEIKRILLSDEVLNINPTTMSRTYLNVSKLTGEIVSEFELGFNSKFSDYKRELKVKSPHLKPVNIYKHYIEKHNIVIQGEKVDFLAGGLHWAKKKVKTTKKIVAADIASMYPQTLINLHILDDESHDKYVQTRDNRIILKRQGSHLANVEKLKLNTTFGTLGSKYNKNLYNPQLMYTTTLYGQMCMLELCLELDLAGIKLIQINTDGVYFTETDEIDYKAIISKWQDKFNYEMEFSYFDKLFQVSVNEYLAVKKVPEYRTFNDYWEDALNKSPFYNKGGLFKTTDFNSNPNSPNKYGIIDKAFFGHLLFGLDPIDIIEEEKDIKMFQIPTSIGRTYDYVMCSKTGKKFQNNNRLFACVGNGYNLVKVKQDSISKFPKIPTNAKIINEDIRDYDMINDIDYSYYINLVYEKINEIKFKEL